MIFSGRVASFSLAVSGEAKRMQLFGSLIQTGLVLGELLNGMTTKTYICSPVVSPLPPVA